MEPDRLLIVNADDYGRTPEISHGILVAFSAGVLKSTTMIANLVTREEIDDALDAGIACGLHFNLTCGKPVSTVPKEFLRPDLSFDKNKALNLPTEIIKAELELQWDFAAAHGVRLSHIDSHHHIHSYPNVLALVAEFAIMRGVPVRPCDEGTAFYLNKLGIASPQQFSAKFYGQDSVSADKFIAILESSNARSLEIMTHPGYSSPLLESESTYSKERELELAVLTNQELASAIAALGWTPGNYFDL